MKCFQTSLSLCGFFNGAWDVLFHLSARPFPSGPPVVSQQLVVPCPAQAIVRVLSIYPDRSFNDPLPDAGLDC